MRAELFDIRATRFEAKLRDGRVEPPFDVNIHMSPSFDVLPGGNAEDGWVCMYSFAYEVDVVAETTAVLEARITLNAAYGLPFDEVPLDEELMAFGETTVALALYPYVREFVGDATNRFSLPSLVLPVYRQAIKLEHTPVPSKKSRPAKAAKKSSKKELPAPRTAATKKRTTTKSAPTKTVSRKKSRTA